MNKTLPTNKTILRFLGLLCLAVRLAAAEPVPAQDHAAARDLSRFADQTGQQGQRQAGPMEMFVKKYRDGRLAPDFPMTDIDGKPLRLADFAGKVVVLDFWAPWCAPCIAAMPHTEAVAAKYKDQGVVVIGSCTNDTRDEFEKWVRDNTAKYPHIVWAFDPLEKSPERASRKLYKVMGIPMQIVIDRNGRMVDAILGNHPDKPLLEEGLARAGITIDSTAPAK